jgi:hypothetical protein
MQDLPVVQAFTQTTLRAAISDLLFHPQWWATYLTPALRKSKSFAAAVITILPILGAPVKKMCGQIWVTTIPWNYLSTFDYNHFVFAIFRPIISPLRRKNEASFRKTSNDYRISC